MKVSAIIVTRGDVDLSEIDASLPKDWEFIVWDNGKEEVRIDGPDEQGWGIAKDMSVYGRYAAIERASGDLIYVQDDDVIVSDPQAIVDQHVAHTTHRGDIVPSPVVCNMPQEFRHDFYSDHALVGFGAAFHRDAPERAWWNFRKGFDESAAWVDFDMPFFRRTCDIVFTGLTPRVLVDVPKQGLPWENDDNRMWKQPEHQAERARMLELMKGVRDGS